MKSHIHQTLTSLFLRGRLGNTFPNRGTSWTHIQRRLKITRKEYDIKSARFTLGWLSTRPNQKAVSVYRQFLSSNPNNLGNWSAPQREAWGTKQFEKEIIAQMAHLYKSNMRILRGYITSGGTEGNIFSAWLGKTTLLHHTSLDKICLLRTNLTHYSIRKSAKIIGVSEVVVPLDTNLWAMDSKAFTKTVHDQYRSGIRGFLIPLTIGYTNTGTSDPVQKIIQSIYAAQRTYKHIHFYVWIDAALNGLTQPFLDQDFAPFREPLIQTFLVDFHKFGQIPYPAGLILFRESLEQHISSNIDYLPESDATLLGSRTGIPAAVIWSLIQWHGRQGYRQIARKQLGYKNVFIDRLRESHPTCEVLTERTSLTCGVIFHSFPDQQLPKSLTDKYGLFAKPIPYVFTTGPRTACVYTFHFLPHVRMSVLNQFLRDLNTIHN